MQTKYYMFRTNECAFRLTIWDLGADTVEQTPDKTIITTHNGYVTEVWTITKKQVKCVVYRENKFGRREVVKTTVFRGLISHGFVADDESETYI